MMFLLHLFFALVWQLTMEFFPSSNFARNYYLFDLCARCFVHILIYENPDIDYCDIPTLGALSLFILRCEIYENPGIVLLATKLGNGYERGRCKGRGRRPNRSNEHPERRENEAVILRWGYWVDNIQILVDRDMYKSPNT